MQSEHFIMLIIGILALSVLVIVLGKPLKALFMLCIRSAIGTAAIFAADFLLSPAGLAVGINAFTALVTGLLGIPGFITLYVLAWILGR